MTDLVRERKSGYKPHLRSQERLFAQRCRSATYLDFELPFRSMMRIRHTLRVVLSVSLGLAALLAAAALRAESFYDSFESPQPTWRLAETDCAHLVAQRRVIDDGHRGQGSELLQLQCNHGTKAYLTHAIPPARVIDELSADLWVRGNRPGFQLMLRVVFPRVPSPQGDGPLTALLRGSTYEQVGQWQRLTVDKPFEKLTRLMPSLRHEFGESVKQQYGVEVTRREAYVDMLVLNAYASPGLTQVKLDDLEIRNVVKARPASTTTIVNRSASIQLHGVAPPESESRFEGGILLIENRPFFPRAVEHRGESLTWLKELGFNTILLQHAAGEEEMQLAERLDLWLISPPGQRSADDVSVRRVLAWSLGRDRTAEDLAEVDREASRLRASSQKRPTLVHAQQRLGAFSRAAQIVLLDRRPLGTTLSLQDYSRWLRDQQRWLQTGTSPWSVIQTEPDPRLEEQVALFRGNREAAPPLDPQQVRVLTYQAVSAGMRGLVFASRNRLDAPDPATRLRAKTLKQINTELDRFAPWLAAGRPLQDRTDSGGRLQTAVLEVGRARLAVVRRPQIDQQYVAGPLPAEALDLHVPGVPLTDQAYLITAGGTRPLRIQHREQSRITLENPADISLLLLTDDPQAIHYLNRRLLDEARAELALRYELAEGWFAHVLRTHQQLDGAFHALPYADAAVGRARQSLRAARQLMEENSLASCEQALQESLLHVAAIRHGHWRQAAGVFPAPVSSPLCVNYETLPLHWALAGQLAVRRWGGNALGAGTFEDLEQMVEHGWQQQRAELSDVAIRVDLSLDDPHNGRHALRLSAHSNDGADAGRLVDQTLVQIHSGEVPVRAGNVIQFSGWVKIATPLIGSPDGLLVYDSLGDRELGLRLRNTSGWQRWTLYRMARQDGAVRIHLALRGLGEVLLDDMSIAVLDGPLNAPALGTETEAEAGVTLPLGG